MVIAFVVLIGGGGAAAILLIGNEESRTLGAGGSELAKPVTSEPEEQWSWSGSDYIGGAVRVGDRVLVATGEGGELVSLDKGGDEEWSTDLADGAYGASLVPGREDMVITAAYEGEGFVAFSTDDGHELWSRDSGYYAGSTDSGVYFNGEEFGLLDPETGDERWSTAGPDAYAVADGALYMLDDGELSRRSPETGEEEWSIDSGVDSADEYIPMAATEDLVVRGGHDATAFDAASGAELWTAPGGVDGTDVGVFSETEVYVSPTDYTSDVPETTVTIHDRDGERGELDIHGGDSYFYAAPFKVDGKAYALDYGTGTIYDDELESIGQYDGTITLVDGGVYTLEEDELSYYELGAGSPTWTMSVPGGDSQQVVAADDVIELVTDDEVTEYR